ncbi:MAG: MFS transporter [Chloroflexota bacterium]
MTDTALDRSYRALFGVPTLARMILGMQIARIAQSMVSVVLVLFALDRYGSPWIAGVVTFAAVFPGLIVSPIAGALLDRHGRVRLVILDYLVALGALVLIAALAVADLLPAPLLVLIAALSSLTLVFSTTGLRTLFPLLVPEHLWERANAIDSNGYVVAQILGPPVAAGIFVVAGGPAALVVIAAGYGIAAAAVLGVNDPVTETDSTGSILRDAWRGAAYTWRNPTLRGLGFAISAVNVSGGMTTVLIPLLVINRLGLGEAVVGIPFALTGLAGMASALYVGRFDTRGREWPLLVGPAIAAVPAVALLLPVAASAPHGSPGAIDPVLGFALIAASTLLMGAVTGPFDVALFTVRQRRTDPAWLGRAFAVSMSFNFLGYPVGAAIAGTLASQSYPAAIWLGVAGCAISAVVIATMVPRTDDRSVPPRQFRGAEATTGASTDSTSVK